MHCSRLTLHELRLKAALKFDDLAVHKGSRCADRGFRSGVSGGLWRRGSAPSVDGRETWGRPNAAHHGVTLSLACPFTLQDSHTSRGKRCSLIEVRLEACCHHTGSQCDVLGRGREWKQRSKGKLMHRIELLVSTVSLSGSLSWNESSCPYGWIGRSLVCSRRPR